MKKLLIVCLVVSCLLALSSFTKPDNEWGEWSVVSYEYKGIEARVKKGDYNEYAKAYYWYIQFRNRYTGSVVFNYDLKARSERSDCDPDKRKSLSADESSDVTAALINDDYKVHVCIDNVRIN